MSDTQSEDPGAKPPSGDRSAVPAGSIRVGQWLVNVAGQEVVEMSHAAVASAWRGGKFSDRTLVWHPGMPEWLPLHQVRAFQIDAARASVPELSRPAAPPRPSAPSRSAPAAPISTDALPAEDSSAPRVLATYQRPIPTLTFEDSTTGSKEPSALPKPGDRTSGAAALPVPPPPVPPPPVPPPPPALAAQVSAAPVSAPASVVAPESSLVPVTSSDSLDSAVLHLTANRGITLAKAIAASIASAVVASVLTGLLLRSADPEGGAKAAALPARATPPSAPKCPAPPEPVCPAPEAAPAYAEPVEQSARGAAAANDDEASNKAGRGASARPAVARRRAAPRAANEGEAASGEESTETTASGAGEPPLESASGDEASGRPVWQSTPGF